jgi:hypothetical protein
MPTVTKWTNVAVAMQSAIGANLTITAVTLANPAVVTSASHGLANGDYVLLTTTNGMRQISGRIVRCANITTSTFETEGVDSTLYDAFVAGYANKLTFGTSIATLTTINSGGAGFNFIDATTIHVDRVTKVPGLPPEMTYDFDALWDPADTGSIAMKTASDAQAQRSFKFTFGTGGKIMVFNGYVGFTGTPAGTAQDKVTTKVAITSFGLPTYYAS